MTLAQSPGCARRCCADSALFQGLILNLCFSHPPQALSNVFFSSVLSPIICFAAWAVKLLYLCQHLPIRRSCRRDLMCLSSSLIPPYFISNQTTRSSSVHAVQRETNPTGQGCAANSSQGVQAQREPSQGGLTPRSVYPDNHPDP